VVGGALPGGAVTIQEPGWLCGSDVIVRAKVKPEGSHV
jgi:hypothetical protein